MVWEFDQLEMLSWNARGEPVEDVEVKKGNLVVLKLVWFFIDVFILSDLEVTLNLVPISRSNPICARKHLSWMWTGDERAHAWNTFSKWQPCFDVLNNEFDSAVKFSLTKRGYDQLIFVVVVCIINSTRAVNPFVRNRTNSYDRKGSAEKWSAYICKSLG